MREMRVPALRLLIGAIGSTAAILASIGVIAAIGDPSLLGTDEVTALAGRFGIPVQFLIVTGLALPLVAGAATGSFVFFRRPDDPLAMVFGLMLVTLSSYTSRGLIALSELVPVVEPFGSANAVVAFSSFTYFLLVFPAERFANRLETVLWLVATVFIASRPGFAQALATRRLDEATSSLDRFYLAGFIALFLILTVALLVRFVHARGTARQQMKWVLLPIAGVGAYVTLVILVPSLFFELSPTAFAAGLVGAIPISLAFPFCIARGVLKYRLYDIDVVINRALVYGTLTAILAGCYVGLVFGLQAALAPLTAESDLAIAGSTLAVAALFRPVRVRVQEFIDKRFYRQKFDRERTIEEFNVRLRDEVDLGQLSSQLVNVVTDTMHPAHVSLWLRTESTR